MRAGIEASERDETIALTTDEADAYYETSVLPRTATVPLEIAGETEACSMCGRYSERVDDVFMELREVESY